MGVLRYKLLFTFRFKMLEREGVIGSHFGVILKSLSGLVEIFIPF